MPGIGNLFKPVYCHLFVEEKILPAMKGLYGLGIEIDGVPNYRSLARKAA